MLRDRLLALIRRTPAPRPSGTMSAPAPAPSPAALDEEQALLAALDAAIDQVRGCDPDAPVRYAGTFQAPRWAGLPAFLRHTAVRTNLEVVRMAVDEGWLRTTVTIRVTGRTSDLERFLRQVRASFHAYLYDDAPSVALRRSR